MYWKLNLKIAQLSWKVMFSIISITHFNLQRRPQWRTWGCRIGGAEAPWGEAPSRLSFPPDCRSSPERSLRPAAIHSGLLPHSPGPSGVFCAGVPRHSPWPQPLDQLPPPPGAHRSHHAIWLVLPPTCQPVWANRGVQRGRVGSGGAPSGDSGDGDPLSAVAAVAGGLEGGSS